MFSSHYYKAQVVLGLILLGSVSLPAQKTTTKNTTTTPAKPAARPAAKPGGGLAGTSNQGGQTKNSTASRPGPTANGGAPPPKSATTGVTGRPLARGDQQVQLKGGNALQRRQNGQISDVHVAGQ